MSYDAYGVDVSMRNERNALRAKLDAAEALNSKLLAACLRVNDSASPLGMPLETWTTLREAIQAAGEVP